MGVGLWRMPVYLWGSAAGQLSLTVPALPIFRSAPWWSLTSQTS